MTDEPKRFRSRDRLNRYGEKKVKEFKWLEHKVIIAKTQEAKEKAIVKLAKWFDNHPTFAKQILANTLKRLGD
jgi:hypothetical protein